MVDPGILDHGCVLCGRKNEINKPGFRVVFRAKGTRFCPVEVGVLGAGCTTKFKKVDRTGPIHQDVAVGFVSKETR